MAALVFNIKPSKPGFGIIFITNFYQEELSSTNAKYLFGMISSNNMSISRTRIHAKAIINTSVFGIGIIDVSWLGSIRALYLRNCHQSSRLECNRVMLSDI